MDTAQSTQRDTRPLSGGAEFAANIGGYSGAPTLGEFAFLMENHTESWSTPEAQTDADELAAAFAELERKLAESEDETSARLGVKSAAEVVDEARLQDSRITELLNQSLGERRGSRPWSAKAFTSTDNRPASALPRSSISRPASAPAHVTRPASAPPRQLAGRPASAASSATSSAGASSGTPKDVVTIRAAKAGRWREVDDAIADGHHPLGPWLLEACDAECVDIDEAEAVVAFVRRLLAASSTPAAVVAWENGHGHAALHVLAMRGGSASPSVGLLLASVAAVVIQYGADTNKPDPQGFAPLHLLVLAASNAVGPASRSQGPNPSSPVGSAGVAEWRTPQQLAHALLDGGANWLQPDASGRTAFDLAEAGGVGSAGLAALLRRAEALRQLQYRGGNENTALGKTVEVNEEGSDSEQSEAEYGDADGKHDCSDTSSFADEAGHRSEHAASVVNRRRPRSGGIVARSRGDTSDGALKAEQLLNRPASAPPRAPNRRPQSAPPVDRAGPRDTLLQSVSGSWPDRNASTSEEEKDEGGEGQEDDDDDDVLPPHAEHGHTGTDSSEEEYDQHRPMELRRPTSAASTRTANSSDDNSSSLTPSRPSSALVGAQRRQQQQSRPWSATPAFPRGGARDQVEQVSRVQNALERRKLETRVLAVEGEVVEMRNDLSRVKAALHEMRTDFHQLTLVVQQLVDSAPRAPKPVPTVSKILPEGEERMAWAYGVVGGEEVDELRDEVDTLAEDGPAAGLGLSGPAHRDFADDEPAGKGVPRAAPKQPPPFHGQTHRTTTLGLV